MPHNPLDEIQTRADAATEGPWVEFHENGEPGELEAFNCAPATGAFLIEYGADRDQQQRDANFIAHAREDVPKLVAALRSIEELLAYWDTLADGDRYYAESVRARIREALG